MNSKRTMLEIARSKKITGKNNVRDNIYQSVDFYEAWIEKYRYSSSITLLNLERLLQLYCFSFYNVIYAKAGQANLRVFIFIIIINKRNSQELPHNYSNFLLPHKTFSEYQTVSYYFPIRKCSSRVSCSLRNKLYVLFVVVFFFL